MLIIKLFKPTLVITSIIFLIGLAVFYYFNFVSSGFSPAFGPSSRTTEAKVYLVSALFLFGFSTILNLFGRSVQNDKIISTNLVQILKNLYLWATLLLTGLFVIAALLVIFDGQSSFNLRLSFFSSVSALWACYLYKAIPAVANNSPKPTQ